MKKALCICLIIAAVLLVAGGVCMTVGFFRNGGFPSFPGKEYEEKTLTFPKEAKEIRTNLGVQDILVKPGEDDEIRIRWFETENEPMLVASSDGTVSVTDPKKNGFRFFWDWFWYKEKKLLVTIELPAEFSGSLTLVTDTGSIEVQGTQIPGEGLTVRASTGSVKITDCAFSSAEIRATTGETELENVTVGAKEGTTGALRIAVETGEISCRNVTAKDAELSASTGKTETEDLNCTSFSSVTSTGEQSHTRLTVTGDAEIRVTTGDVETDTLTAGGALRVTSTTGSQSLHGIRAGVSIWLEATTGSIRGSLRGTENYYAKDCSSGTGNMRLPQFAAGGTVPLTARTTTGSIRLDAAD